MYVKVSNEEIELEAKTGFRPRAMDAGCQELPLCDLSDREFEILTYHLLNIEIKNGDHEGYDSISLMQGVGERGRDCVIYNNGNIAAVVQCKKYQNNVTKPSFLKELIKYLLHCTLDGTLFDENKINYLFYVSKSLTEPAIALTNQFTKEINKEIDSGVIREYITSVVNDYASFEAYVDNEPFDEIERLLKKTNVKACHGTDLSLRIQNNPQLLQRFFKVISVIDRESNIEDLKNLLEEVGLPTLTDVDLKHLQKRINSIEPEKRANFGSFDFYGYDREFLKSLSVDELGELFKLISNITLFMNKKLFNYLSNKVTELTLKEITIPLINKGLIHPYSVNIATMYLTQRSSKHIVEGVWPDHLHRKYHPEHFMPKNKLIDKIIDGLLESSRKYLNGDYSLMKGTPDEISFKINTLFPSFHRGLNTLDDINQQIEKDLKLLNPIIDKIESNISTLLKSEKTIVIKDCDLFSNKDMMPNIKDTFQYLR